jgi:hypothetical protein
VNLRTDPWEGGDARSDTDRRALAVDPRQIFGGHQPSGGIVSMDEAASLANDTAADRRDIGELLSR